MKMNIYVNDLMKHLKMNFLFRNDQVINYETLDFLLMRWCFHFNQLEYFNDSFIDFQMDRAAILYGSKVFGYSNFEP